MTNARPRIARTHIQLSTGLHAVIHDPHHRPGDLVLGQNVKHLLRHQLATRRRRGRGRVQTRATAVIGRWPSSMALHQLAGPAGTSPTQPPRLTTATHDCHENREVRQRDAVADA